LLIGRPERREQFAILTTVECYDDDPLRVLGAGGVLSGMMPTRPRLRVQDVGAGN
jgi:hypothetical protein